MPWLLESSRRGCHPLPCCALHSPQPAGGAGADEGQRPCLCTGDEPLSPYNKSLSTYLQCALRG